ncbi:PREDICTED: homeobox-leucine zipper protein ROC8-like [Populus euphratica]|uniref:Homeobox-leucine zipper protein ROC8-like n=1 Tax=Populus euphratica TaxID=75702 RepID=A0AAJ6T730_POPEU|nr:PREDICTED: homeobox-leucine zipper protein ROC8-like [Populus euphratica]
MELSMGNNGGASGDEHEAASNSRNKGKKGYHRHSNQQIQQLEKFFKECPHPDENQRRQLSRELGLEAKQIKFWFQNKRTQKKAQSERADNSVLRLENERIQCENLAIIEALKNVICPACGGPPFGEEERQRSLQKLKQENARLKEEHEKVSTLLNKYIGKSISQIDSLTLGAGSSDGVLTTNPGIDLERNPGLDNSPLVYRRRGILDMEKALMAETAASAADELVRLLRVNEPLWIKSPSDGRYILDHVGYEKLYPRDSHFKSANARVESSKDSAMVIMPGMDLVDMFLDANKWIDLFPTIVTKARTILVLEAGTAGNRNGSLQMMYEQMHILSPLVPPREFYFLRLCQQLDPGEWVIADISYDFMRDGFPSRAWRLPSGCMIQDKSNGCSKVTWVEHVEVDDRTQTHRLYRDLICGRSAYGAERWIASLRRICERLAFYKEETAAARDFGGVITSPEGRKSIVNLAHRMVKIFFASLGMSGKLDFPQFSEVNNSGVRVAIRKNTEQGQPVGMVVSAATSLWLPLSPQIVFNFFKDERSRIQVYEKWDVLSNSNPVHVISHISNGTNPGNCISITRCSINYSQKAYSNSVLIHFQQVYLCNSLIVFPFKLKQPFIPTENNMLILQESCTDSSGSMVVYAPLDIPAMNMVIDGADSSIIPILPSGFVISGDGHPDTGGDSSTSTSSTGADSGGSLLTVAFQILVAGPNATSSTELNMESVATVNTLISTTVLKIKAALNCSNLG